LKNDSSSRINLTDLTTWKHSKSKYQGLGNRAFFVFKYLNLKLNILTLVCIKQKWLPIIW
jgi:hypothetical protein